MTARISKDALDAAQARTAMLAARVTSTGQPRTLARRALSHTRPDFDKLPDSRVRAMMDRKRSEKIIHFAAAALNGADLATAISPEDRLLLSGCIPDDARTFALSNRKLSRHRPRLMGEQLQEQIAADQTEVAAAWSSHDTSDPMIAAAIDAALDATEAKNG